jgi:flagellar biosynthesis protein FlhG
MPDRSRGHRGRPAREAPALDQAAGLRRLFAPSEPHWLPVVLAPEQDLDNAGWLADLARACVEQGARTLVVDAARAQIAAAFGLRARYDLAHAFSGDCAPSEASVRAGINLRILPAARALEEDGRGPDRKRRFAAGVRALAVTADCVLLVLPPRHGRALAGFGGSVGFSDALVVAGPGSGGERQLIETMRSLLRIADIDAFRLLFQGTSTDYAGRLLSKLAASGVRQLSVGTSDAGSVHDASAIRRLVRQVRCRSTSAAVERAGPALESVS